MKNHTKEVDKKQLDEAVDSLTKENQRCFLRVLEAFAFAQTAQDQKEEYKNERIAFALMQKHSQIILCTVLTPLVSYSLNN
jgi:hypothetical protein